MNLPSPFAGRYEIARQLGRGASAVVVQARDVERDGDVALKVLVPEFATALGPARFLREIRLATRLQHPYIVPVLDSGEWQGWLYYAMPVITGTSLRARIVGERQLPVADAVQYAGEIADALRHAHEEGVLHRDVKPENILLAGGHACLADFGIARAVTPTSGEEITSTGVVVGTPTYMSPEQAAGASVDGRSDQYSLACVLFEMLAGIPPFVGSTEQSVIMQRIANPAPPLHQFRPAVGQGLADVVARALETTPADRYPSMAVFAQALKDAAERPSARIAASPAPARPRWTRPATVAASLVLAGALGAGAWWGFRANREALAAAGSVSFMAEPDSTVAPTARDLYRRARDDFATGRVDRAIAGFARAGDADPSFALAPLWQAQLIQWGAARPDAPDWLVPATRAMRSRARLGARDAHHALALVALGDERYADACREFGEVVRADSQSFAGWLGAGECRRLDRAVVADQRSPSGWRFRAEFSDAVRAYSEALALAPGEQVGSAFRRAVRVFQYSASAVIRPGSAIPPDSMAFLAYPELVHDTVAFVPHPVARAASLDPMTAPRSRGAALRRVQDMELAFVRGWIQKMPGSVDALAAYSLALESRGDLADASGAAPDALSLIRTARARNTDARQAIPLQAAEVRLLTKLGRFTEAGRVADSALRSAVVRDELAGTLAALGALQGRERETAEHLKALWSGTDRGQPGVPLSPGIVDRLAPFVAAVEAGACNAAHLDSLERGVRGIIATMEEPRQRAQVSASLVDDVLLSATVCTDGASARRLQRFDNPFARLANAAARRDRATVGALLARLDASRAGNSRANLSWDIVALEGWALGSTGAVQHAAARLDSSLASLAFSSTGLTTEVRLAGGLRRTLQLRSALAAQLGDTATRARWQSALKGLSYPQS